MADIFGRIKRTIDKGVTTVSVKSTGLLESTKVKGFISSLTDQREEMIKDLGNIVYSLYSNDNLDKEQIIQKCNEIKLIEDKIKEKQIELERIQKEQEEILGNNGQGSAVKCECGAVLQAESNFCVKCGKKIK